MALFFDSTWFDAKLAAVGLQHSHVAATLGLSVEQVGELWKDQRELSAADVRALAALLHAPATEIAARAGVSTPVPSDQPADELARVHERLDRVERMLADIKALVLDLRARMQ
jgi:transcriptional regulator with XRE-family HTH domain